MELTPERYSLKRVGQEVPSRIRALRKGTQSLQIEMNKIDDNIDGAVDSLNRIWIQRKRVDNKHPKANCMGACD